MTNYRFNHLSNEYETVAAERAALVFRGTHEVEVWRDGEEIGSLNIDIYSDIPYSDFDDKALAALGEFANENQTMTKTAQEIIAEAAADMEMSEAEFVEAYGLGGSIAEGFTREEIDILNRHIWGWDPDGDPDFTLLDNIGQYDQAAVGIDPADYPQYEGFAAALIECAVQCGWTDTVTARAAVEREEHILRMSHRQAGAQPYYVGSTGVPARSGEHNDRAVFVGRDEATVRAEMEQVWQENDWVTEWESYGVWKFDTLEDATKFATLLAGGEYWEEVD